MKSSVISMITLCILLNLGCEKDNTLDNNGDDAGNENLIVDPVADVYMAGYTYGASNLGHNTQIALYWKNGVPIPLTDPTGYAEARSIVVLGNDVYVAGQNRVDTEFGLRTRAVYWKNGEEHILPGDYDYVTSMKIFGNDVYITAGYVHNQGKVTNELVYFKNGVLQHLQRPLQGTSVSITGISNSLFVSNGSVHVVGASNQYNIHANYMGLYWKDGVFPSSWGTNTYGHYGWANDIYVEGNDVHIVGSGRANVNGSLQGQIGNYWKNGTIQYLFSDGLTSSAALTGIAGRGTDIHIVGYAGRRSQYVPMSGQPKYWRNGAEFELESGGLDRKTNNIQLLRDHVYICGAAGYWKDLKYQSISGGTINSIFVKAK